MQGDFLHAGHWALIYYRQRNTVLKNMHLNKRGNTTKEQEKMQGFLGESVVAVKAAKKKKPQQQGPAGNSIKTLQKAQP